jgi:uncharacterized membrane protein YidH (DUF202 family)
MTYAPDAGLQPQRTALAWKRTGLALFVNALVILRSGFQEQHTLLIALGIAMAIGSGWMASYGTWRAKQLARHVVPGLPAEPVVLGIAVLACAVSLTGLLSIALG